MNIRRSILLAAAMLTLVTIASTGCSKKDSGPTGPGGGTQFESGDILDGGEFQFVFTTEGHFAYHCRRHTVMQSTIHVLTGGPDTLRVNIVSSLASGFDAQGVSVRPGGRVIWSNVSGVTHTVTSD